MIVRTQQVQKGLSLVELMISIVLGLLVAIAASNVYLSNKQSYRTNNAVSRVQENARIAFELIGRDLRQARSTGCGNQGAVSNLLNINAGTGALDWYSDFAARGLIAFDGAIVDTNPALTTGTSPGNHVSGTDNMTLIGVGDLSYSLASDYVASDGLDITESNPELAPGDLVVICDPSQADIVQITSLNGDKFRVATGTGTPGNSGGLAYIYRSSNTLVSPLKSVTWYIGCNPVAALNCDPDLGGTSLYRLTAVGVTASVSVATQAQEMVRGVSSLDLSFHQVGTDTFEDAEDIASWAPNLIDAVRSDLQFVGFDGANATGTQIIRNQSVTVALRNPPQG